MCIRDRADGARRGGCRGHRTDAHRTRRGDGRRADRAVRRREEAGRPERGGACGRARRLRPVRGPLARGHPCVLPGLRGPGHAARRDGPARTLRTAAGTGDAGGTRTRRPPGRHPALAREGDAGDHEGDGTCRRAQGRRGPGATARHPYQGDAHRRPGPFVEGRPATSPRRRLGPHDPGQPQELRAPPRTGGGRHGGARAPRRVRAGGPVGEEGRDPLRRPVGIHGRLDRPRRGLRCRARLHEDPGDPAGGVRHGRRRPHRPVARSGRRAVRHAARRWDRHQPRAGLLPVEDHPSGGHRRRPRQ